MYLEKITTNGRVKNFSKFPIKDLNKTVQCVDQYDFYFFKYILSNKV